MTNRERILAVLGYTSYDRLPILHFGFLQETLRKWNLEGHLSDEEYEALARAADQDIALESLTNRLGFDCAFHRVFAPNTRLHPAFAPQVVEILSDGARKVLTPNGAIVIEKDDAGSIPMEYDHVLKGRKEWDEIFGQRLQYSESRVDSAVVNCEVEMRRFDSGGLDYLIRPNRENHYILHCGSLYGVLRDYMGMENLCYLAMDDEELLSEMIEVNAELCYKCAESVLNSGARFEFAHFWEDICFKNGPLVNPTFFADRVATHYQRIADLAASSGISFVSVDCDGLIDTLVPAWLENGVNVMFPIEVGTWNGNLRTWRERYGKQVLGIGGMRKHTLAQDHMAVDAEIERLIPLVELGGYIPCPDHRIADDAEWDNVCYYTQRMREVFG